MKQIYYPICETCKEEINLVGECQCTRSGLFKRNGELMTTELDHCSKCGEAFIYNTKHECKKEFTKVQDSGQRREFETGAVRDIQETKGRYDLISPIAMKRLAKHFQNGAIKYGDRNWEKGIPLHSFFDSGKRHLDDYMECRMMGKEQDEDHLAAALWNIQCLIHTEEMIKRGKLPEELDDLPKGE